MNAKDAVQRRIKLYNPKGNLGHTAKLFLAIAKVNHSQVKAHSERVALLSEAAAKKMRKDALAAFFAGLLHDFGKILLPGELFDGHNFEDPAEYELVKTHAQGGFIALKEIHLFTALCAGLHHNLYEKGYGASINDIPAKWAARTIKKVLEMSTIISIADFVDAFTTRKTKIKDGSDQGPTLKDMLYSKYKDDKLIVDIVLEALKHLFPDQAKIA